MLFPFLTAVLQSRGIELFIWAAQVLWDENFLCWLLWEKASLRLCFSKELLVSRPEKVLCTGLFAFHYLLPKVLPSLGSLILRWGGSAGDQDTMIWNFLFSIGLLNSKFALQGKPLCWIFLRFPPGFLNLKPHWRHPAWRGLLLCFCRLTSREKFFLI